MLYCISIRVCVYIYITRTHNNYILLYYNSNTSCQSAMLYFTFLIQRIKARVIKPSPASKTGNPVTWHINWFGLSVGSDVHKTQSKLVKPGRF